MSQDTGTPAGWHPDPSGVPNHLRYWDGNAWTEHTAPTPTAEPAPRPAAPKVPMAPPMPQTPSLPPLSATLSPQAAPSASNPAPPAALPTVNYPPGHPLAGQGAEATFRPPPLWANSQPASQSGSNEGESKRSGLSSVTGSLGFHALTSAVWVALYALVMNYVLSEAPSFVAESVDDYNWMALGMIGAAALATLSIVSLLITGWNHQFSTERGMIAVLCLLAFWGVNYYFLSNFESVFIDTTGRFASSTTSTDTRGVVMPIIFLWAMYRGAAKPPRAPNFARYFNTFVAVGGVGFAAYAAFSILGS